MSRLQQVLAWLFAPLCPYCRQPLARGHDDHDCPLKEIP